MHISNYWRNTASLCSSSTRLSDFQWTIIHNQIVVFNSWKKKTYASITAIVEISSKTSLFFQATLLKPTFLFGHLSALRHNLLPRIVVDTVVRFHRTRCHDYIPKTSLLNLELAVGNLCTYIYINMSKISKCI